VGGIDRDAAEDCQDEKKQEPFFKILGIGGTGGNTHANCPWSGDSHQNQYMYI
jgi:hypothetical protein